jgi:transposase
MAKVKTSVLFKRYTQQQSLLLPPSLEELIGSTHLVRVVNEVVERMDLTALINLYKGGGTTAYHPRMLLKVLLYGYCMKIYTGRKMAQALLQDIHFMWLAAYNRPDFRTLNEFRSGKAKEVIETLFAQVLVFLLEEGYIKMEQYFCDGSTFRADGNQHKMVWKKSAEKYKALAEQKCRELFEQIEQLNQAEDHRYGDGDLEENGTGTSVSPEAIDRQVERLNETLENTVDKKQKRKGHSLARKLGEQKEKINSYNHQIQTAGARSGYNKTDEDAAAMRMKNKEVLPAYNVLSGSEGQFLTGVSVHQNSNDAACFKEHLEAMERQMPVLPAAVVADSIFGSEENYEALEQRGMDNYLKFPTFHAEGKKSFTQDAFLKENLRYDPLTDSYACPGERRLVYRHTTQATARRSGYLSFLKVYACEGCADCPLRPKCFTGEGNRVIHVNETLEHYKEQARQNLHSEKGRQLRKQRGVEIESCFGDLKHNMNFRRFHLRGLQKVKTEFTLVAMAHNLRKVHLQRAQKAQNRSKAA